MKSFEVSKDFLWSFNHQNLAEKRSKIWARVQIIGKLFAVSTCTISQEDFLRVDELKGFTLKVILKVNELSQTTSRCGTHIA